MREHKYRAWHKQIQRMEEVNAIYFQVLRVLCCIDDDFVWYGDEIELMEYTGLKDCNGQAICESDIVTIAHTSLLIQPGTIGVVNYANGRYVIDTHAHTHGLNMFVDRRYRRYGKPYIEVVGNLWETPHLAPRK